MSSTYIQNFIGEDRARILKVIDDFDKGKSLEHYKNRFIADNMINTNLVDWKKRYCTSNYMNFIIKEYMGYINKLTEVDRSFMRNKDGSKNLKKAKLVKSFFKINSWNSLFKRCASNRKKYGDVYLYWHLVERNGATIPKIKFLDSRYMTVKTDLDGFAFAYVYERTVEYDEENTKGEFITKEKTVKWVFQTGKVDIFEDGVFTKTVENRSIFNDKISIIHLQFMKEEDTPYSEIPAESFIDLCLDLDRIETEIALINTLMSAPQLIILDGELDDENSAFGANGILYVESKLKDSLEKVTQAKIVQLEITNDLQSLKDERASKLEILYNKANLVSPEIYSKLATTDSSKVWDSVRKDLEQEIKDLYEEIIDKFSVVFEILFKVNKIELPAEGEGQVSFEMPEYIIDKTIYDKYMLKAQKMNIGELSITENLRNKGLTEQEIKRLKDEYNQEILEKNKDLSFQNKSKSPSTVGKVQTKESSTSEVTGIDNNFKKV